MRFNYPYLTDYQFLKDFDNSNNKTQKVRITILDFQENPIKEIQGRVTGGSINLDGASAIRRSLSLSLIADDFGENLININNLFAINKKIAVEIGFVNKLTKYREYDVLWFPLGVFVMFNPNCTHSKEGLNISLQAKDKMCLLNGECGGVLPASIIFHEEEVYNPRTGEAKISKIPVFKIIRELVHHHGNELLSNILINDVPTEIKRALKWNGAEPLYIHTGENKESSFYPESALPVPSDIEDFSQWLKNNNYVEYVKGQELGYEYTEFTYPGELICNAGETVCNVLDKIKNMLGNFEYFYDINGTFIFQEIRNYLNTTQATTFLKDNTNPNYEADFSKGHTAYTFETHNLIDSFSNAPQYSMIKNDFMVWGERKNAAGNPMPIRYHLAIDRKPKTGNSYLVGFFIEPNTNILKALPVDTSFLELNKISNPQFDRIYQIRNLNWSIWETFYLDLKEIKYYPKFERKEMIIDNQFKYWYVYDVVLSEDIQINNDLKGVFSIYKGSDIQNVYLLQDASSNNSFKLYSPININPSYIDVEANLSQIGYYKAQYRAKDYLYYEYYPEVEGDYRNVTYEYDVQTIVTKDWREELYYSGLFAGLHGTDVNYYYAELANEWPKMFNLKEQDFYENVKNSGTEMDFFLDFIDIDSTLGKYCIENLGRRSKVVSDNSVNCIFEPEIPNLLWRRVGATDASTDNNANAIGVTDAMYKQMVSGGNYNSAFYMIQDLLYQHTSYNESITVVTQPIYYLEPNTLITVTDIKSGIQGDYLVKSFSIPLDISGTMTLSCIKPLERI